VNIKELEHNETRWISIVNPGAEETNFLRERFSFRRHDIEDCLTPSQRAKLERTPEYFFLVLLFPCYNRKQKIIEPFEIDIFFTQTTCVTVQDRNGPVLQELFHEASANETFRATLFDHGPIKLLETILHRLLTATFPMIDHISLDVKDIEKRLFAGNERAFLEELVVVRRNIAVFRKTMQAHKFILRKLINALSHPNAILPLGPHAHGFENLIEHTKEVWDAIDIQKEEIETLAITNESLISFRLNEIMKKYTTLSVMIFAMTLLAALLTIDAHGKPFVGSRNAFWYIIMLEATLAGVLYAIFRRKRWL
jgi:magnesium transporter